MAFTHYPKLACNGLLSACWYAEGDPRNTLPHPLEGEGKVELFAEVQNFTRLYGTVASPHPLKVEFGFSNEDLVVVPRERLLFVGGNGKAKQTYDALLPDGVREQFPVTDRGTREATDEDLPGLNYDGGPPPIVYTPGGKGEFWVIITGRWFRVRVTNPGVSSVPLRVLVRASVF